MGVLIAIIVLDIAVLALVMRLVLSEPPHGRPAPHPFVLADRAQAEEADGDAPG